MCSCEPKYLITVEAGADPEVAGLLVEGVTAKVHLAVERHGDGRVGEDLAAGHDDVLGHVDLPDAVDFSDVVEVERGRPEGLHEVVGVDPAGAIVRGYEK